MKLLSSFPPCKVGELAAAGQQCPLVPWLENHSTLSLPVSFEAKADRPWDGPASQDRLHSVPQSTLSKPWSPVLYPEPKSLLCLREEPGVRPSKEPEPGSPCC